MIIGAVEIMEGRNKVLRKSVRMMIMTTWLSFRVIREREGFVFLHQSDPKLSRFLGYTSDIQDESRLAVRILNSPPYAFLVFVFSSAVETLMISSPAL